jgi:hypothetical protein
MDNDDSGTFNAGDMAIPNVTVHGCTQQVRTTAWMLHWPPT